MFWFVSCHFWQVAFLVLLCLISRLLNKPDDTIHPKNICHYDHHQCQQQPQQKNQQIVCGNSLTVKPSYTHSASIDATAEVKKNKKKTTSLMYLFQTWHMIHRSFTDIYLQGPCVVFIINKNKCAAWTIFSWGCGKKETNSPQNAEKLIFERTFFLLHMTNLDIVTCFSLTELY